MLRVTCTIIGLLIASSITTAHEKCHANLSGLGMITTNSNTAQNSTCTLPSEAYVGSMTGDDDSERRKPVVNVGNVTGASSFDDNEVEDEDAKLERLMAWVKEHGGIIDAVKVSTISGYRGVVAARDMKHGGFGMTIPARLFISLISVLEDPSLGPIYTANLNFFGEDEYLILSVFLAHHMQLQNKSFYFPYLSLLPEPETIDNWADDELSVLQDSAIIQRAYKRKHDLLDHYHTLSALLFRKYPDVFTPDVFPFHMFRFAYQTITARSFGDPVQNCSSKFENICPETVLVPFVDMLNHATHGTEWFGYENRFHWHPAITYREGEQVFLTYGNRPNDDLLSYYGFAMEHNEFDTFNLNMDPATYAVLPKIESQNAPTDLTFTLTLSTKIEEDILPHVRGLFLPANMSDANRINASVPISRDSERQALDFVFYHVQQQLDSLPTTLEQDTAFLDDRRKQNNLPHKLHAALIYRMSRKRILQHVLSSVTETTERLNNLNSDSALESLYEAWNEVKA